MMNLSTQIILASNSPRRHELMHALGYTFSIETYPLEEVYPDSLSAVEVPIYLSKYKSLNFRELKENELLITADTVVVLENEVLGKPKNRKEAIGMLERLSGKAHDVVTGVFIRQGQQEEIIEDTTTVFFKELNLKEIEHYVDTFSPFDKAGGYGIQEWIGQIAITEIRGSYFNVMGLPVHKVYEALENNFS